ncbi:sensor histidine kinase [Taibaiella koreensis]|uniref:sensor histidine kinase n=1 Tax=Taibaiella koreensis TaxID=1268548 RepID=UPI000E59C781|nr:histidine kinase [Taibaiella koreensis]
MYRYYLCCLLLYCFNGALAASPRSVASLHFGSEDGLPSDLIYSSFADSKGYIWFATNKGISRFNGTRFTNFTTSDGLTDNEVFGFMEDMHNRIWIFSFKGDLCYYKDGLFHSEANTPWLKMPPGSPPFYSRFLIEYDSSLTAFSSDCRVIFNLKDKQISRYNVERINQQLPANTKILGVRKLSPATYRLWYGSSVLDVDTSMHVLNRRSYRGPGYTQALLSGNAMVLTNSEGIYTPDGKPVQVFTDGKRHAVTCIEPIGEGHRLLGVDSFLLLDKQTILKNVYVTGITPDLSGNYWIATKNSGVFYINGNLLDRVGFGKTYEGRVQHAARFGNTISFVTELDNFYQLRKDSVAILYKGKNYIDTRKNLFFNIHYLIWDSLSYLKFHDAYQFRVHVTPSGTTEQRAIPGILNGEKLSGVIKDAFRVGDYLYLSTISRLLRMPSALLFGGKASIEILVDSRNDWNRRITARASNPYDQSVWLSRVDGMLRLQDTAVHHPSGFQNVVFRQMGFWGGYLIGKTDNNRLLVCSDFNQKPLISVVENQKCIWERIYPIDKRHLIVSTNNYYRLLTLYQGKQGEMPRYSVKIIEDPFLPQQAEYIIADTAYCYFFKDGAISKLRTALLYWETPPPAPVFSVFRTRGRSYPVRPQITIPYSESKSINIVFDNISFLSKEINCEYSIAQGGQEEWTTITGNEINLNTPGFGDYTIKVRSKTLSSRYSEPILLRLTILRPYWATWWFIALCVLALVALVWCFVLALTWLNLRKKQKEHEADMKYQQSEYKALNALMNPHFIFNSLNNIQGLINKDEKRTANEYLVIFSDLVRQNMNNISRGFISLQQELNLVENYLTLEKLRFKELVSYSIVVEDDVETEDIMIPPLMIQPLVENAVKHGLLPRQSANSIVHIHVFEKDNLLHVDIEDNGIGITRSLQSKNRLYESFGLVNLRKRTEHLKKIQQHEIEIDVVELNDGNQITGTRASIKMSLDSY